MEDAKTSKIRDIANKIISDAAGHEYTIKHYRNVAENGTVDSLACSINNCTGEEYISAVKLAVSEL